MERPDVDGRLTEKAERHSLLVQVLGGKRYARSQREVPAHDGVAAQESHALIKKVHRSALALRAAGLLAEKFRHDGARLHPSRQRMAVITIGAENGILRFERHDGADRDGFLPDVKMAKPANLPQGIHLCCLLFEAPDQ